MSRTAKLTPVKTTTATDLAFEALYTAIMTLELTPGTKVSEVAIAADLQVSRQPVRDAFYRLSKLGFIRIRPQRATVISHISVEDLHDARYIRAALEVENLKTAIAKITEVEVTELERLLVKQERAIEEDKPLEFHDLDDELHRRLAEIAGHPRTWSLIRDQKVHLDRIRFLSLAQGASIALEEHKGIVTAIKQRDVNKAENLLRQHLARIETILAAVQVEHAEYFEDLT